MYVVKHKNNNNYYQKTIFKGQTHFVRRIEEAKRMRYETAVKLISNFMKPDNYEIKEIKK